MRDHLVLIVANYPDPKGEVFLELELKELEKKFRKISIIQTKKTAVSSNNFLFLPKNANVFKLVHSKINFFIKSFYFIFSKEIISELILLLKNKQSRFNIESYKSLCYYHSYFIDSKSWFYNFFKTQVNFEQSIFYTYWCDQSTYTLAKLKKKHSDLTFVSRVHGWDLYPERHETKYLPFRPFIFNKTSKIYTISKHGYNFLRDNYPNSGNSKFDISFLGVKSLGINCNYLKVEKKSNILHVLTISSIIPVKNLFCLVDSLSLIEDEEIQWTHIGSSDNEEYKTDFFHFCDVKLSNKLNINFEFKGFSPASFIMNYLKNESVDLLINCSFSEGLPVSLMEGASAGIPMIGFNVGGISEIIENGKNGFLIEDNNSAVELSKKIILFSKMNFEERIQFSQNAYNLWAKKFDYSKNYNLFGEELLDINN